MSDSPPIEVLEEGSEVEETVVDIDDENREIAAPVIFHEAQYERRQRSEDDCQECDHDNDRHVERESNMMVILLLSALTFSNAVGVGFIVAEIANNPNFIIAFMIFGTLLCIFVSLTIRQCWKRYRERRNKLRSCSIEVSADDPEAGMSNMGRCSIEETRQEIPMQQIRRLGMSEENLAGVGSEVLEPRERVKESESSSDQDCYTVKPINVHEVQADVEPRNNDRGDTPSDIRYLEILTTEEMEELSSDFEETTL